MGIVSFDNGTPQVLDGEPASSPDRVYGTASEDFELSRIDLAMGRQYLGQAAHGPDSIIVLDGAATLTARSRSILLARGAIVFVPFGTHYSLNARVQSLRSAMRTARISGKSDAGRRPATKTRVTYRPSESFLRPLRMSRRRSPAVERSNP